MLAGSVSSESTRSSLRNTRSISPSMSMVSTRTDDSLATAMTDLTDNTSPINESFRLRFSEIVQHWRNGSMAKDDEEFLSSVYVSAEDYIIITEDFSLAHGNELNKNRIQLHEFPTAVHEYLNRCMDVWVQAVYGRSIMKLGSTSIVFSEYMLRFSTSIRCWTRETSRLGLCPKEHACSFASQSSQISTRQQIHLPNSRF